MGQQNSKEQRRFIQKIKNHSWCTFFGPENEQFMKVMLDQFDKEYSHCWKSQKSFSYSWENDKSKGGVYKYNNSFYMGSINKDGQPHGEGVIFYSDLSTYKGEFQKGIPNGGGSLYDCHLNLIQQGNFVLGKFTKGRILKLRDVIEEVQIKREGQYRILYKDGSRYFGKGLLKNSSFWRHGKGKFQIPALNYEYNGEWKMNKREGIATVKDKDNIFEGEYKDDKRYIGKLKQKNWLYDGCWQNGQVFTGKLQNRNAHATFKVVNNQIQNNQ